MYVLFEFLFLYFVCHVYIVNECCGITYSRALNWTLRNGGYVRKFNAKNKSIEPRRIFGDWEVFIHSEIVTGVHGEYIEAIWGSVSFRKDCVGNTKGT